MSNLDRTEYFSGQEILVEDLAQDQNGRQQADQSLSADYWLSGIIKDPNGLSNFDVTVDGTTATLINVGQGTGYANGFRIAISADKDYNAAAPFASTDGICTPQSTGNKGIPLADSTAGVSNFVWAEFLEVTRTNPKSISTVDASIHFPHKDQGFKIVVTTSNPPGNTEGITNSLFLGTVFGQGDSVALSAAPDGICQLQQQFTELLGNDTVATRNIQFGSVTADKLDTTNQFIFNGACFTTLIASSQIDIPLQPIRATTAVSKRFAERSGYGFALGNDQYDIVSDGFGEITSINISGDNVGTLTVEYDGVCNVTAVVENLNDRSSRQDLTYETQDGLSLLTKIVLSG